MKGPNPTPQTYQAQRRREIPIRNEDRATNQIERLLKTFKKAGRKWRRPVNKNAAELQAHLATITKRKGKPMARQRREAHVKMPPWYDQECKNKARALQEALDKGEEHQETYKRLKSDSEDWQESRGDGHKRRGMRICWRNSIDSPNVFGQISRNTRAAFRLTEVDVWLQNGRKLYEDLGQQDARQTLEPHDGGTLFTDKMVKQAIQQLKSGKSGDHLGLTIEIFKSLKETTLVSTITQLFNKIHQEGRLPRTGVTVSQFHYSRQGIR